MSKIDQFVNSSYTGNASVSVYDIEPVSSTAARITARVTHSQESRGDDSIVMEAVASAFDNKLRPVEGSFRSLSKNTVSEVITGVVGLLPESVPYVEDMDGFRAVAGNMFMDDDEKIWALRDSEAGALLVKTSDVNSLAELNDLMTGVASTAPAHDFEFMEAAASAQSVYGNVEGGHFVTYVNGQNETVFGVVCASVFTHDDKPTDTVSVLSYDGDQPELIKRSSVVDVHPVDGLDMPNDMEAVAGAKSNISIEDVAAYYGKVFQRNAEYFNKFMERWKAHFA